MIGWKRHWWLPLVGTAVLSLLALAFAVWFVARLLPLDGYGGNALVTDLVLAGDIVLVLLGTGAVSALKAILARRRNERVQAALDGQPDALPLASISVDDATTEDGAEPIVARWPRARMRAIGQLVGGFVIALFVAAMAGNLAFALLAAAHVLVPGPLAAFIRWESPNRSSPTAASDLTYAYTTSATAVLSTILLFGAPLLVLAPLLPTGLRGIVFAPVQLRCDSEGLTWRGVWGIQRQIRWSDARLLQVSTFRISQGQGRPSRQSTQYTLVGRESTVEWAPALTRSGQPLHVFDQIVGYIVTATHLQPRTLDPKLLPPGTALPTSALERIDRYAARTIFIGGFVLSMVGLGITDPKLLIGEGVIFGVAGAVALIGKLGTIARRRYETGVSGDVLSSRVDQQMSPLLLASGAIYEMTVGSAFMFRLNQIAFAVLGALAAIVGAFFLLLSLFVIRVHALPASWDAIFACAAILGIATVVIALRAQDTIVLADDEGVRKRWLMGNNFIPWAQVESIRQESVFGAPGYRIRAIAGGPTIVWPIAPFHPSRRPWVKGAIQLTPDQMAALVAKRSGKAVEMSD